MLGAAQTKISQLARIRLGLISSDWRSIQQNVKLAMCDRLSRLVELFRQVEGDANARSKHQREDHN